MRSWWCAFALCACAASARAEWQPVEAPPIPPETEAAERARAAAPEPPVPSAQPAPTAPPGRVSPAPAPAAQPAAAPPARATSAAQSGGRNVDPDAAPAPAAADPLSAFPPAPPPFVPTPTEPASAGQTEPAEQPVPPQAALTQFAPAPAPPEVAGPAAQPEPAPAAPMPAAEPERAAAAPPSPPRLWSAAALLGVGVTFDNTVAGVNPLGFGFGVRGDYRILPEWSLGARLLYFVGGSVELPSVEVSMQSWLLALEGAYVAQLDAVTIQPGLALGLHQRETDSRESFLSPASEPTLIAPANSSRFGLYVAPGVNVSVPLALATPALEPFNLGADVRLDLVFGEHVSSNLQLLVQAGVLF